MENITLPDSITSIGNDAFYLCKKLESITIPDSATSIGESAFMYCEKLESITIPSNITKIGESAFDGCTLLKTVNYKGSEEQWEKINIDYGNECLKKVDIIYNYK